MQFIFFLLSLFAIGCVLYGISAGVQSIQRGFSWMARGGWDDGAPGAQTGQSGTSNETGVPAHLVLMPKAMEQVPKGFPVLQGIGELRELFALYRQGALTKDEYEQLKRKLMAKD